MGIHDVYVYMYVYVYVHVRVRISMCAIVFILTVYVCIHAFVLLQLWKSICMRECVSVRICTFV